MAPRTKLRDARKAWIEENPLRLKRTAERLSILDAASQLGVSPAAVQQWESGATTPSHDASWSALRLFVGRGVERLWAEWLDQRPS